MRTTLVIGASENTERYSNRAVRMLKQHHVTVIALGLKEGMIGDVKIETGFPKIKNLHTVTLYVSPQHQSGYYNYILNLKPKRVIFNPGAENPELEDKFRKAGIEVLEACTLVMLSVGDY